VLDVTAQILVSTPGPTPIVANQLYFLIKLLTRWFSINIIFCMTRCALSQTMIGLITVFNDMIRYDCYVSKAQCPLRSEHFSLHFITFPYFSRNSFSDRNVLSTTYGLVHTSPVPCQLCFIRLTTEYCRRNSESRCVRLRFGAASGPQPQIGGLIDIYSHLLTFSRIRVIDARHLRPLSVGNS
jgi:hypothetical protein